MKVTVLLFASLREAAGMPMVEVDIADGATAAELIASLRASHPGLATHLPYVKVAVNREFAAAEMALHDGDEVALIPPVGGG